MRKKNDDTKSKCSMLHAGELHTKEEFLSFYDHAPLSSVHFVWAHVKRLCVFCLFLSLFFFVHHFSLILLLFFFNVHYFSLFLFYFYFFFKTHANRQLKRRNKKSQIKQNRKTKKNERQSLKLEVLGFFGTETSFSVPLDDDDDGTQRDTTLTRNAIFFLHFIFSLKLFRIIN